LYRLLHNLPYHVWLSPSEACWDSSWWVNCNCPHALTRNPHQEFRRVFEYNLLKHCCSLLYPIRGFFSSSNSAAAYITHNPCLVTDEATIG